MGVLDISQSEGSLSYKLDSSKCSSKACSNDSLDKSLSTQTTPTSTLNPNKSQRRGIDSTRKNSKTTCTTNTTETDHSTTDRMPALIQAGHSDIPISASYQSTHDRGSLSMNRINHNPNVELRNHQEWTAKNIATNVKPLDNQLLHSNAYHHHSNGYPVQSGHLPESLVTSAVTRTPQKIEGIRANGVLPKVISDTPLKAMHVSTKKMLSIKLDAETQLMNEDGRFLNWEGLAEYMDLAPDLIDYISEHRETKTTTIIDVWNRRHSHTFGDLWTLLNRLGRVDVVCDSNVYRKLRFDARRYFMEMEEERIRTARAWFPKILCKPHKNLEEKDEDVRIDPGEAMKIRRDEGVDEHDVIVVQDIVTGPNKPKIIFDAYVSFCDKNMTFVSELINFLEHQHKMKLCIKERDLLAGSATHYAVAHLIKHRCKKMIVVMSPDYLQSAECDYQTKVALALNRTPIILMYEECEVPPAINFMCILRHSELPADWFWKRLHKAVEDERSSIFQSPKDTKTQPLDLIQPSRKRSNIPKPLRVVFQCVLPMRQQNRRQNRGSKTKETSDVKGKTHLCPGCGNMNDFDVCACATKKSKMADEMKPEVTVLPDIVNNQSLRGEINQNVVRNLTKRSPRPSPNQRPCACALERCPSIEEMKKAAEAMDTTPIVYTGRNAFRGCFRQPEMTRFEDQGDFDSIEDGFSDVEFQTPAVGEGQMKKMKRNDSHRKIKVTKIRNVTVQSATPHQGHKNWMHNDADLKQNNLESDCLDIQRTISSGAKVNVPSNTSYAKENKRPSGLTGMSSNHDPTDIPPIQRPCDSNQQAPCSTNPNMDNRFSCDGSTHAEPSAEPIVPTKTSDSLRVHPSITLDKRLHHDFQCSNGNTSRHRFQCHIDSNDDENGLQPHCEHDAQILVTINRNVKMSTSNIPLVVQDESFYQSESVPSAELEKRSVQNRKGHHVMKVDNSVDSGNVTALFNESEQVFRDVGLLNPEISC